MNGCTSDRGAESADCTPQIRVGETTYSLRFYSDRPAESHAAGDDSECHDNGRNAPGTIFADDPRQVETWTFAGYSARRVLAVKAVGGDPAFAVYLADDLPEPDQRAIERDLQRPERDVTSPADPTASRRR